jgi:hypothetical protein
MSFFGVFGTTAGAGQTVAVAANLVFRGFGQEHRDRERYARGGAAVERLFHCILVELAGHAVDSEDDGS